jgi:hypothetical protein
MLTGLPPLIHGVYTNGGVLPHTTVSLVRRLRETGFLTGGFVSGFPLKALACGLDQGFLEYDDKMAFMDSYNQTYAGRLLQIVPLFETGIYRSAPEVTGPALHWLANNSGAPFFLFLHYYDPHFPYGKKQILKKSYKALDIDATPADLPEEKRLYAMEVETVDREIGRVLSWLKDHELYDKTLLIVTSDHGESLGEHNYYYDHTQYLYEQMLRVPLIIRCPALFAAGRRIEDLVGLIDVHHAILHAAGLVQQPGELLQLAGGGTQIAPRTLFSERYGESTYEKYSARTKEWKFIRTDSQPVVYELYNIREDPGETRNVIVENQQMASSFQRLLQQHLALRKAGPEKSDLTREQIEQLKSLGYVQ